MAEDADMFGAAAQGPSGVAQPMHMPMPAPTFDAPQTPYSIWNVLSLGLVVMLLCVSGMMMMDIMFNMWSFSGTTSVTTGIMDSFMAVLGK